MQVPPPFILKVNMNKTDFFVKMKLAEDILAARTKGDISFRELSGVLEIDIATLYRIECGEAPKLDNFFIICRWLGKPMETYFKKSEKVKK
jgi:transcriptional regulator with XRE-family HTH domain